MLINEHGVSVGIHRVNDAFFMRVAVQGKLTHEDYKVIIPLLDNAVAGVDGAHIKLLVECRDFEGWELRAAWDDFKLGLKHGREFKKIAIVGDKPWEKAIARVGSWFIGGEMKFFEDRRQAIQWLTA